MADNLRRCASRARAPVRPAARVGHTVAVAPPAPYDAQNFLQLLGIDVPMPEEDRDMVARLTVSHALIAGTGFLWAPVVIAMADALCAFGVSRHWPEGARSFTTLNCSSQFLASAREGEEVTATAAPLHLGRSTQVWDATVINETTERLMASYRCTQMILY
jgi:1,4-dihydroxy-2-naphthoyl-CoA hydrolase